MSGKALYIGRFVGGNDNEDSYVAYRELTENESGSVGYLTGPINLQRLTGLIEGVVTSELGDAIVKNGIPRKIVRNHFSRGRIATVEEEKLQPILNQILFPIPNTRYYHPNQT